MSTRTEVNPSCAVSAASTPGAPGAQVRGAACEPVATGRAPRHRPARALLATVLLAVSAWTAAPPAAQAQPRPGVQLQPPPGQPQPSRQARSGAALDLRGYSDAAGAVTVLHGGDTTDPYFAMQALLLAHDNGLDIAAPAQKFVDWLLPRQKPDGTFDRFCRQANGDWLGCKAADADDSLLAMWMRLMDALPALRDGQPAWTQSYAVSRAALDHLYQPSRGVYMVSPLVLHGLFMDNLEVWSLKSGRPQPAEQAEAKRLARDIHATFWNPVDRRYLVSTQLEQRGQPPAFYPDHVAQVFPLLVDFPMPGVDSRAFYRQWMRQHRAAWLAQGRADYPWGLIAVMALREGDDASVRCWLREALPLRHSARWAVSDEASLQVIESRGLQAAPSAADCR